MLATCGSATATFLPSGIFPVDDIPSHDCEPIALPTVGVGQPESATVRRLLSLFPAALLPFCAGVPAMGVGHPASHATRPSRAFSGTFACSLPSFQSRVVGVGQADTAPVVPISDVRRTDARRRERDTPEGVTHGFQISVYKVDPVIDSLARNLLSKHDWRLALCDEVVEGGP